MKKILLIVVSCWLLVVSCGAQDKPKAPAKKQTLSECQAELTRLTALIQQVERKNDSLKQITTEAIALLKKKKYASAKKILEGN